MRYVWLVYLGALFYQPVFNPSTDALDWLAVAVLIALVGFLLTAGRLVMRMRELTFGPAVLSQMAMAVICLVFVVLSIKSFKDARRNP